MAGFEHASGQVIVTCRPTTRSKPAKSRSSSPASIPPTSSSAGATRARRPFGAHAPRGCSTACSAGSRASSSTTSAAAPVRSIGAYSRKSSFTATSTASWPCWPTDRASVSARWTCSSPPRIASGRLPAARVHARPAGHLHRVLPGALHQEAAALLRHGGCHDVRGRRAGRDLARVRPPVFWPALAERPALLLASLLVVLGLQLFALGLLGELMIFTHARTIKDYQIERVIQFSANQSPAPTTRRSIAG
jgi:hypothetical protein